MSQAPGREAQILPRGVMLNAYPDSIGSRLSDIVAMLKRPEFRDTFSLFYILPTFFNSDLDRGFSIKDYNLNEELVSPQDLEQLKELGITIKVDLVLNHLSVHSPQFLLDSSCGRADPFQSLFSISISTPPWKLLLPERVTALITPPTAPPYSAM